MTGKLKFENNKWKITFENEKGDTKTLFCQPNVFAQGFEPGKEGETEIDFDRDTTPQKNACKVRLKGQAWQGETVSEKPLDYQGKKQEAIEQSKQPKSFQKSYSDKPKEKQKENAVMSNEFHNPYNFVPAIPRGSITGELADREPSGHDRYISDKLSGKLTVKMTVETPLVLLDTARVEMQGDHKKFPVRVENGKPYINPTAVKGMLRSAYEAVTNSRLSVFTKHNDRLAFRMESTEGAMSVPARIENGKIVLYTGTSGRPQNNGKPRDGQPVYAAWLGKYGRQGKVKVEKPNGEIDWRYKNHNNLDENETEVWAYITPWRYERGRIRFNFWNVVELRDGNLSEPNDSPQDMREDWKGRKLSGNGKWVKGFVCYTSSSKTKGNIQNKHDERVFFHKPEDSSFQKIEIPLEDIQEKEWERLITNYGEIHADETPPKDEQGRLLYEWSRNIKKAKEEKILKDGMVFYARVQWNGAKFEVLELYPVMISRRLHKVSPDSLLDDNLKPAMLIEDVKNQDGTIKHKSEMSPADRVFGFVRQKRKDKNRKDIPLKGKVAGYRGQIRIGSVTTERMDAIQDFNDLPLNILGQPKPQQGRFYVAKDKQGNAQTIQENNEGAGYKTGRGLRGRKVYPHHAHIEGEEFWFQSPTENFNEQGNHWSGEFTNSKGKKHFREYLRPKGLNKQTNQIEQQRDSQNRSIQGWVKPKTVFEFDIHFTNLSKVELGALIWLLDMDKYANGEGENHKYFHRFGGGKPLGFGSVSLSLKDSDCEIYEGEELKKRYESLDDVQMEKTEAKTCQSEFEKIANQDILKSFKVACKGFDDKLPIHYPRARNYKIHNNSVQYVDNNGNHISDSSIVPPNPDGKSFEWFVANSKNEIKERVKINNNNVDLDILPNSKTGKKVIEPRFPLDNLWKDDKEDAGLPILPHKKSRD